MNDQGVYRYSVYSFFTYLKHQLLCILMERTQKNESILGASLFKKIIWNNSGGNMDKKEMIEQNRVAWNEAIMYHQKARDFSLQEGFEQPDFSTFDRDCDDVLLKQLTKIDFTDKTIAQMPCNNGRVLLSIMNLGAKKAVGFDISDTAIEEARQLAESAKLDATFERTNILEINDRYNHSFDFIYISEGSLQWFPDVNELFSTVSRLLKPNGQFLIFEMHPFAYFFENGFDKDRQGFDSLTSYFEKGPYQYQEGLDYVGDLKYESEECFWFMHKVSDIVMALINNQIEIQEINEYNLEMANNPETAFLDKFPLSYLISGKKQASM